MKQGRVKLLKTPWRWTSWTAS